MWLAMWPSDGFVSALHINVESDHVALTLEFVRLFVSDPQ